ncbi:retinol dehydrogenase 13-like [Liolophura sinensis]|uniref:retinol dehydrogenase 13-like n=1 Tax=Liolophura sinensis TaxID=3198878 RepID=UPI0031589B26
MVQQEINMPFYSDLTELISDFSFDNLKSFCENHYILLSGLLSTAVGLKLLRTYFVGGVFRSKARLDGKTVVITGGNTGIGFETALDLAKRGARVVLGCRDVTRGEEAAKKIRRASGNGNIIFRRLDLASLESVRQFARETLAAEKDIHILLNNAGIMMCPNWKSVEGYEMQFATNHLGHFLLTNLLLEKIKKSAPSRIINVSSRAHIRGQINFDDINFQKEYHPRLAYSQSKLANVLFTRELSRRLEGTGVTVNALHPGMVNTELARHMSEAGYHMWALYPLYPLLMLVSKTPEQGAQTSIYAAVSEEAGKVTGKYFSDCALKDPVLPENSEEVERRLWDLSEEMVGLKTH